MNSLLKVFLGVSLAFGIIIALLFKFEIGMFITYLSVGLILISRDYDKNSLQRYSVVVGILIFLFSFVYLFIKGII
ncbi:hypothetical protein P9D34_13480 [Bacillus swezeyi]|uniref:DUF3953 domain-containing protein n=1 Tax=Bacillus swezeyi TaxID=1925020 RepID=A0A1R1QPU1_9BACI|nr:hypothetical protein [Bacillus swezeyi]MEC1261444.1 hypothetical protein [Bacillus swezeyi]MED2926693.1 hypothetical protein [Bacillus swezeyi]MED2944166.1 hypothetical protein [Bacillus swezeyi]MED2965745.1 hypothetical protein [Bacillus swezeyi]MED3070852.1 hypothetical protein [Bacillus swezeyi]